MANLDGAEILRRLKQFVEGLQSTQSGSPKPDGFKKFEPCTVHTPVGALNRKDAAKYCGISTRYLDKLAASGELRRVKVGTKAVFRVIDLDAFLESRLEPPPCKSPEEP